MTPATPTGAEDLLWTTHVDGSSNNKGSVAGLIMENQDGVVAEVSLTFSFLTSNNQAEHEACIAGLSLAKDSDFLLVVSQTREAYVTKNVILQRYLAKVKELVV